MTPVTLHLQEIRNRLGNGRDKKMK